LKVIWSNTAIEHLLTLFEQISKDSPLYAQRIIERLIDRSEQIAVFPLMGREVPEYQVRDIREVLEPPFRLIYQLHADQIDVLAVIHSTRILPPEL
jgi:toxin ParE1/3/4